MRESSSLMSHSFSHSVLGLAHTYRLFLSFPRWLHDTTLSERRRLGAIINHNPSIITRPAIAHRENSESKPPAT